MAYKVAVASSDGKVVNQHFGRATQFLIFDIEDESFKFSKLIKTAPFCSNGEHDDAKLSLATESLVGCRAILVTQIGNGAMEALERKGIEAFDIKGLIDDALNKIILYYSKYDGGNLYG
jgi:nitrogen fixation protein NifX